MYEGSHLINTRLRLGTLHYLAEARRLEAKLARSNRTRRQSNAHVTLAGEAKPIAVVAQYVPPKLKCPSMEKRARAALLKLEAAENGTDSYCFMEERPAHWMLDAGLIGENPRDPESGKYRLTMAGKNYCDWLRSKK